ncbi:MAG: ComF family protein [Deltaproteobacteria bacterium]|nr:ComF family protein [Deltaproteobacteria bacterium]
MLIHIAKAFKKALFPTRCLVCGSFFHSIEHNICDVKPGPTDADRSNLVQEFIKKIVSTSARDIYYLDNIHNVFNKLMAHFLCPNCTSGFLPVESPKCSRCGMMFKSREGKDHICGECLDSPKRFQMARSAGIYKDTLMAVIHCFKYKGKIQLSRPLGTLLFAAFVSFWDKMNIDLIVPVPLHSKKLRMRGFNPSFLLVKDWVSIAKFLNVRLPDIPVNIDVLTRRRWTEPQTGLGRKERLANIKNAFNINNDSKIAGKRILLVDDVYTTGATVNECSKVLLKGGAGRVDVLTLARANFC